MRSKIAQKIINETPQEVKDQVKEGADKMAMESLKEKPDFTDEAMKYADISNTETADHESILAAGHWIAGAHYGYNILQMELSLAKEEIERLKQELLSFNKQHLPNECIMRYNDVKFCSFRQSDGGKCKHCI